MVSFILDYLFLPLIVSFLGFGCLCLILFGVYVVAVDFVVLTCLCFALGCFVPDEFGSWDWLGLC